MLKNFYRVNVLQKYFNTKILEQKSGRTYRESNCHGKVRNYICGYHVYIKSMGGDGLRGVGVRKRAQKLFRSIRCGCEKRIIIIEHLPRKLSRVCTVFAIEKYTFASVSVEREYVEWCGV